MNRTLVAVGAVLAAAALFGTSGTARALLAPDSWPPGVAAVRLLVGATGLVLVVLVAQRGRQWLALLKHPLVWVSGVGVAGYQALFFIGVERTGVAVGTLVSLGLAPLMAGLLGWLVREGAPGWPWAAATTVAVAGLALLTLSGSATVDPWGVAAALGAGACYSIYTVFGTRLVVDHDSTAVMAAAFTVGAVLVLPFLPSAAAWWNTPEGVLLALWLGLAATTAAYVLFGIGLRGLQPGHVATLNLFEPVVATVLGVWLLGERLPAIAWVGCGLILCALAAVGLLERRSTPDPV